MTSAIPKRINAMQKITVPYRITRRMQTAYFDLLNLKDAYALLLEEVKGYGGSSCLTSFNVTTCGEYVICPNTAQQRKGTRCTSYTVGVPQTCPSGTSGGYYTGGGGGGGSYSGVGGGGQGGGGYIPGSSPEPLKTGNPCECKADCTRTNECNGDNVCVKQKCISNNPIEDLDQCPNRVDNPDMGKEYNGCSVPDWLIPILEALGRSGDDPMGSGKSSFMPACKYHDACYGTCRKNKLLDCDLIFTSKLDEICMTAYSDISEAIYLAVCLEYANTYGFFVTTLGWDAYRERQKRGCNCCP